LKPRVINLDLETVPEDAVYIGRPSKWANPFVIGKDGDRNTVKDKYIEYMKNNPQLIADVRAELKGKNLLCYCKPAQCHGDLLILISNDESFDINDMDSIFKLIKQRNNNGI